MNIMEWSHYLFSLASAILPEQQAHFNLRRKALALVRKDLMQKQLITAVVLFIIVFGSLATYGYIQLSRLSTALITLEQTEVNRLKKIFPADSKARKKNKLNLLVKDAQKLIGDKNEMWAPFSQQRLRPLSLLQELTRIIDKHLFDVTVQEVAITTDENGIPLVEITGIFRSKTGVEHFRHFSVLEKNFDESKTLALTEEIDPSPLADDAGIQFTAKLKQKSEML